MPSTGKPYNNLRLGVLVLAGLLFFIGTLYIIGKNEHLFGANFSLRARFGNVNGLMNGDNIRFAGIQAGTVKRIAILNDTSIEVTLMIDKSLRPYIRRNALVSIGNEGLMGNKVINIVPGMGMAEVAQPGDLLAVQSVKGTDEMLATLGRTSDNIEQISLGLKATVSRLNSSEAFWSLLNDGTLGRRLHRSMANIEQASENAGIMTGDLRAMIADVRSGKGGLGVILRDSSLSGDLRAAAARIRSAGEHVDELTSTLNETIVELQRNISNGQGTAHMLLKDPAFSRKLNASMENIRLGTAAFNEDMRALQHNFLLRGYFRRQEKQAKKDSAAAAAAAARLTAKP
jgi:phospholipid/cholesterol/gamma-HCH transport system substrate-binding protein